MRAAAETSDCPGSDGHVVVGRCRVRFVHELIAQRRRDGAGEQRVCHPLVVPRVHDHQRSTVGIARLSGGAHQRGASDVDLLDNVGVPHLAFLEQLDRCAERVEVHDDQLDGDDVCHRKTEAVDVHPELVHVVGARACQHRTMDDGVDRLNPTTHHLRHAGHVFDGSAGDLELRQRQKSAAGGDNLPATSVGEALEEAEASLIAHRSDDSPGRLLRCARGHGGSFFACLPLGSRGRLHKTAASVLKIRNKSTNQKSSGILADVH